MPLNAKIDIQINSERNRRVFYPMNRFRISAGVISLLLLALLCACSEPETSTPVISGPPNTALPMPPLNNRSLNTMGWELVDGKRNTFSEYRGKVLVLDFYATWCEPCRESVPHLIELQKRLGDQGLQVVGLNVGGPEDIEKVPAFASRFRIQYPLGVPDDGLSNFLLSDNSDIPQTFVFDRQGQLTRRFIGFGETTAHELDEAVDAALKTSAN